MGLRNSARIIIYRINKKGLEIFLVNMDPNGDNWQIPESSLFSSLKKEHLIGLEPIQTEDGDFEMALAVEGDWHDIPSIRKIIKEDIEIVKGQLKNKFPELENGTFFAIKEAFKKVMPNEYSFLKELKDIITERNLVKNI
ncbi:MAG: hypothetical protein KA974_04730 [Saprospiraceae bacterium]|nr:hypothetical protein [Saprospiraceae bacterium]MBP7699243.1 hypothetical protein [Saprospiraceae bacterium]